MKVDPHDIGEHEYFLAKYDMPDYSGPDWVPFNLWMQYEYGSEGPVNKECARKLIFTPGAKELWAAIAEKYTSPDNVASGLPRECAESLTLWKNTPRESPAVWKKSRLHLAKQSERIAVALERFFSYRFLVEPSAFGHINFTQLLSEAEQEDMEARILWHNYGIHNLAIKSQGGRGVTFDEFRKVDGSSSTYELLLMDDRYEPGIVPDLPSMMRRIGKLLEEDAQIPPLQRPKGKNAERNYFTRRLITYFKNSQKDFSPSIVAAVVGIFFKQGIGDNEVSQQVQYLPDGRRFARRGRGESSTRK